jgi:quinol monooxygenase YgiN
MSILVVLELDAVEGAEDEMIAVLRRSLVHQDHDRPTSVVLVERWASRADDDAYRVWRAGDGAVPEMAKLVAGPPRIRYFDDVDA